MEEFHWAFLGTGTLAKSIIKAITQTGRHKVLSAYSRNREKLEAFCAPYGTKAASSVEECISEPGVDAVYIVVTNESHYRLAKTCLEAGKNVLLEKPFTIQTEEAEELIALAKAKNVYLAEAMWTWFSDSSFAIRKVIADGKLGEIRNVRFCFSENSIGYAPRVSDPILGGGAVLDIGIYPMTYAYRLFGKPRSMTVKGVLENGVDIKEDIRYEYEGFHVDMYVSIVDNKGNYLYVEGSKGCLMAPNFSACGDAMYKVGEDIGFIRGLGGYAGGYVNEFDKVAEEIRSGRKESLLVPFSSTLDNMQALDEARRQMALVYPFEK